MGNKDNSQTKGKNMSDVRRFMRFVLPGLSSVIILLIALIILNSSKMSCFVKSKNLNDIGVIIGLFLASGDLPPINVPPAKLDF